MAPSHIFASMFELTQNLFTSYHLPFAPLVIKTAEKVFPWLDWSSQQ